MTVLEKIYLKHKIWIDIVKSFGCNEETAEDLTQEMYIKLKRKLDDGLDIDFGDDDYNYFYIFKALKSLFLDLKRKESKVSVICIDDCVNLQTDYNDINYINTYIDIQNELQTMYWYDRKVFEILDAGESVAALSRKTGIPYHSLYNTYRKVIEKLKHLI
jgi:DNA-directed RNA polymerase specialized sigma24 family protein|tara:strand:- start:330 stop:809 length:480 start_codon:yes stop_codon:yes gene_type:complete